MITVDEREKILSNYLAVKSQIAQHQMRLDDANRPVRLIVVSKFQPIDKIRILLAAGHRDFAESRVEEAREKWSVLRQEYPDVILHFIGAIQSKKIPDIVKYSDYIHSVDRVEIAEKISRETQRQSKTLKCLIQVNVGHEPQKAGIELDHFPDFFNTLRKLSGFIVEGVMCIPPATEDPRPFFDIMQKVKKDHSLKELSMGMSSDFLVAIECGSTMLRVGAKILGTRL